MSNSKFSPARGHSLGSASGALPNLIFPATLESFEDLDLALLSKDLLTLREKPVEEKHRIVEQLNRMLCCGKGSDAAVALQWVGYRRDSDDYGYPFDSRTARVFNAVDEVARVFSQGDFALQRLLAGILRQNYIQACTERVTKEFSGLFPNAEPSAREVALTRLKSSAAKGRLDDLFGEHLDSVFLLRLPESRVDFMPLTFTSRCDSKSERDGVCANLTISSEGDTLPIVVIYEDAPDVPNTLRHEYAHVDFSVFRAPPSGRPQSVEERILNELHSRLAEDRPWSMGEALNVMRTYAYKYYTSLKFIAEDSQGPEYRKTYCARLVADADWGEEKLIKNSELLAYRIESLGHSSDGRRSLRSILLHAESLTQALEDISALCVLQSFAGLAPKPT